MKNPKNDEFIVIDEDNAYFGLSCQMISTGFVNSRLARLYHIDDKDSVDPVALEAWQVMKLSVFKSLIVTWSKSKGYLDKAL